MKLSSNFYEKIEKITSEELEEDDHVNIFKGINWENEAKRCCRDLIEFFDRLNLDKFQEKTIGVIDIRWNEYGGDIEVDFMPENDLDIAFDEGCIMNSSAINNDLFFENHFYCSGASSFKVIDRDYVALIKIFFNVFCEISSGLVKSSEFQKLPKKGKYYITFAFFHDEKPEIVFDSKFDV